MADVDAEGKMVGWLVADLKTGRAPKDELKTEVNRQLRLYRDILRDNNPNGPPIRTEGWYTADSTKRTAIGEMHSRMHMRYGKQPNLENTTRP